METDKTCAFTGHRDIEEDISAALLIDTVREIAESGYNTFLCGMARGFDLLAAEAVIELKKQGFDIRLIACVPCPDQQKYFGKSDSERYSAALSECDEVKVLSGKYYKGCMQARDRFMVDNCSLLVAYRRRNEGGTHYTLTYAVKSNKKIKLL